MSAEAEAGELLAAEFEANVHGILGLLGKVFSG